MSKFNNDIYLKIFPPKVEVPTIESSVPSFTPTTDMIEKEEQPEVVDAPLTIEEGGKEENGHNDDVNELDN